MANQIPLAPSLPVRKPSEIKLRSEACLMNIGPEQRKLDFLEGLFSSQGGCPVKHSHSVRTKFAQWDRMLMLASCVLFWSALQKYLVSRPAALSRLRGNSWLSLCTCHHTRLSLVSTLFACYSVFYMLLGTACHL